jgi:hypothetical protein
MVCMVCVCVTDTHVMCLEDNLLSALGPGAALIAQQLGFSSKACSCVLRMCVMFTFALQSLVGTDAKGARRFVGGPKTAQLISLDLSSNNFGDDVEGIYSLGRMLSGMTSLQHLALRDLQSTRTKALVAVSSLVRMQSARGGLGVRAPALLAASSSSSSSSSTPLSASGSGNGALTSGSNSSGGGSSAGGSPMGSPRATPASKAPPRACMC